MRHRSTYDKVWQVVSYHVATDLPNKLGWTSEWDRIAPGLYLGKIPLRGDEDKLEEFVKNQGDPPLGLIVSVVEPAEIEEKCYSMDPVRPEEWRERKIEHKNLVMVDCRSEVDLNMAAEFVLHAQENCRSKNKSAYIHCKAGKSRSAMFTCCLLVMFDLPADKNNKNKSIEELVELAAQYVKQRRDQVNITRALKRTAVEVVKKAKLLQNKTNANSNSQQEAKLSENASLKERADTCFADPAIKDEMKAMEIYNSIISYKDELMKHVHWKLPKSTKPKRVEHIEKLLNSIDEAKDSEWYADLVKTEGPAKDLLDASPIVNVTDADEDRVKREHLIEKLKNDIEGLICLNLLCSKEEFRQLYPPIEEKLTLRI